MPLRTVRRKGSLARVGVLSSPGSGGRAWRGGAAQVVEQQGEVADECLGLVLIELAQEADHGLGLDNSTLLGPLDTADYVFVNHARRDVALPVFAARVFAKRTFRSYVLASLHPNDTASMPVLYHLA